MNLSPHFTLAEFTASQTAARLGIDNMPTPDLIANLGRVAYALELIRDLVGKPIIISSGYRSIALNANTPGSANNSAHTRGCAADFIIPQFGTPFEVCRMIVGMRLPYDQLIFERSWVHLAIEPPTRRQVLTLKPGGGYLHGLVEHPQ